MIKKLQFLAFGLLFITQLNSYGQVSYTTQVLPGSNGKALFKVSPAGHYEWFSSATSINKVNSFDTSFYEASSANYITGPTNDCAAGDIVMYAVDMSSRRGIMRPLSSLAGLAGICPSPMDTKGGAMMIETLYDSVSLDTLSIVQASYNYLLSPTPSYQVLIKDNNITGLYCTPCSGNSNGPGNVLTTVAAVQKDNILNTQQIIKIPINYMFQNAGLYWIDLPYNSTSPYVYLNCPLTLASNSNNWAIPQPDNSTDTLARAMTTYDSHAQVGKYGAFLNLQFTLQKVCNTANGCARIKVEGLNPVTTEISNAQKSTFTLYPNPAKDRLYVSSNNEPVSRIDLITLSGLVLTGAYQSNELSLAGIPQGMYFVKVITGTTSSVEKIIIE